VRETCKLERRIESGVFDVGKKTYLSEIELATSRLLKAVLVETSFNSFNSYSYWEPKNIVIRLRLKRKSVV
jgi:hypothetical protein